MIPKLSWVDSHCHLEMLKGDLATILSEGSKTGLDFCLTIGTQMETCQELLQITHRYRQVYGTLGIHPHNANEFDEAILPILSKTIQSNPKIVAVGECGYDFHYNHSTVFEQQRAFEAQLELAIELSLPVVIHTREAEEKTIETLKKFESGSLKGVFHSFTSSVSLAEFALESGFYISFNGIATFPKSNDVREVLKITPPDRILLETDSPFLAPVPLRGRSNEPQNVRIIGEYVADFLQIPHEELARQTRSNTLNLFSQIPDER